MPGRDLALDANGDLDLTGGGSLVEGQQAIAQRLKIRLLTFLGEYFLDSDRGLPWLEWSSTKFDDLTLRQVKLAALGTVQTETGVVSVDPSQCVATYNRTTRLVTVSIAGVVTDLGPLDQPVVVEI